MSDKGCKMKKLILAAVFSVVSFNVSAELCGNLAHHAEVTMVSHQAGVSLASALEIAADVYGEESEEYLGLRKMIIRAYSEPRYLTEERKKMMVNNFRDEIHVECLKGEFK